MVLTLVHCGTGTKRVPLLISCLEASIVIRLLRNQISVQTNVYVIPHGVKSYEY